jgi:regulator of sirC expression with transglutaminase-like and TPR domain
MQPPDKARLRALPAIVSLLSDENSRVVAEARRALLDHGAKSLPYLDVAIEEGDAKLRARARLVRDDVRVHLLERDFRQLGERLDRDPAALEEACVLVARTRDPDLDPATVRAALDAMADDLGSRLGTNEDPATVLDVMTRLLARELGFQGNQRNYYDPDNSYLHKVLERRTGIPISLCAIYLFVARRLSIPLVGVGMPGHFVLRHARSEPALFVDPFGGGRILNEADCLRYLEAEGEGGYDPTWLLPMSDGAILLRMIRNLLLIYRNRGDVARQQLLQRLKGALVGEETSPRPVDASDPGANPSGEPGLDAGR